MDVVHHLADGQPETAQHATREDPGRASSDVIVLLAAVSSLGAVGLLLLGGAGTGGKVADAALGFGSVALAWSVVHTVFTVRYARLYYTGTDGGIDFNEHGPPQYSDFAYLAFTIGMTYQDPWPLRLAAVEAGKWGCGRPGRRFHRDAFELV